MKISITATLALVAALAQCVVAQPYGYTFTLLLNQTAKVSYPEYCN